MKEIVNTKIKLDEVIAESPNRRRFVTTLGVAGALAATAASLRGQDVPAAPVTDVDILNFALNLEYLEAEFYTIGTEGKYIEDMGIGVDGPTGTPGPTTGGARVDFPDVPNYSKSVVWEVAADERAHVTLIRGALQAAGAPYIAKPAINLDALGIGYGSVQEFFTLARVFEDIGVSAYGGSAPLISDKTILGVAARILAAEAEHVAAIRLQVARYNIQTTALDSLDILPPPTGSRVVSLDANGLSAVRSPGQVLALAYAASNATQGGFFPQGVNGTINMSSTPA